MSSESSPKEPELEPKAMIRLKGVLLDFYLRSALQLPPGWSFKDLPMGVGRREGMRSVCSHGVLSAGLPAASQRTACWLFILLYPGTSESRPR